MLENPNVRVADDREREPVVWPDPSPLSTWWADVMAHRTLQDARVDAMPDPGRSMTLDIRTVRSARSRPSAQEGVG